MIGEIPYPIRGIGKFPNNVESKIIIKYKPTHIEGNLKFFGGNNIKGIGNNAREITPTINHINPIFANKLTIFST